MNTSENNLKELIKARAQRLGFSLAGVTKPAPLEGFPVYEQWLQSGFHAGMQYLETPYHNETRRDPSKLMPGIKSILCLAYPNAMHPIAKMTDSNTLLIAGYASGADYHFVLAEKMKSLVSFIEGQIGAPVQSKQLTDSSPLLERELAQQAGLGWIGRNSCLISPTIGSAFLLCEILLDIDLSPDAPFKNNLCGTCQRCLKSCPTGCIQANCTIDSRNCISYHTIENKGMVPGDIADTINNWLFGCDICQMVCPWNKDTLTGNPENEISISQAITFLEMDQGKFNHEFANSAIKRAKYSGFMRNLLIALANVESPQCLPLITRFHTKCTDPMLQATAVWAIRKLENKTPL